MSSEFSVAYVDVRVFAHATEDLDKVLTAVRNILPPESVDAITFKKTTLTGHHGNPITTFEGRVKNRRIAQALVVRVASGLSLIDKEVLNKEIDQHLEKGNLYIRLDKQSAYMGGFKVGSSDAIHLRIHFRKSSADNVINVCRTFGLLP